MQVLRAVAASYEPLTMTQIRERTGIPHPTLVRLLQALVDERMLERTQDGSYLISVDAMPLAAAAVKQRGLDYIGEQVITDLVEYTGETVSFAMLRGNRVVLIKVRTGKPMGVFSRVGIAHPANCTSGGKVLLASLGEDEVRALYPAEPLPQRTARSITTIKGLLEELARVRERGWALDDEENVPGVRTVAALVRNAAGEPYGALGLGAPVERAPDELVSSLGAAVKRAAERISFQMGYREGRDARGQPL